MDRRDAEKVIQNLQTKTFICSDCCILIDNGYVILKKEYFEELKTSRKLPEEPIKVAEMLIYATEQCESNSIQRAFGAGEYYTCEVYSKSDLKQIAEHLLVHCDNQEQNGLMPADI